MAVPLLRLRLRLRLGVLNPFLRRVCSVAFSGSTRGEDDVSSSGSEFLRGKTCGSSFDRTDDPNSNSRTWRDVEDEIIQHLEPINLLLTDILHSDRYMDGEHLTPDDEKAVVDRLLAYHPNSEDKIGYGLESIMVDQHPQFHASRCLYVVRTDGGWVDFSYKKCLREYIRQKFPAHAERFVREKVGIRFRHRQQRFNLRKSGRRC